MTEKNQRPGIGPRRQGEILSQNLSATERGIPLSFEELEQKAIESVDEEIAGYITAGAGRGDTQTANRKAFDRWRILPRVLQGIADRELGVQVAGQEWDVPVGLAPIGGLGDIHPSGERATARAALKLDVPVVLSATATMPMEDVAEAAGTTPKWFQLLISSEPRINESLVSRAEKAGYDAIVVTIDTPQRGWRPEEFDSGFSVYERGVTGLGNYFSDPEFTDRLDPLSKVAAKVPAIKNNLNYLKRVPPIRELIETRGKRSSALLHKPAMSWQDIEEIKRLTSLPVVLKGILHPLDAEKALDIGVDGVIVSNHGGNHIDGAIASLDALPPIAETVGDELDVLFDSGIRSGADVFKALALGADAVLIGRPFVYGLALNGEQGVHSVLKNILAELDVTMVNCGISSIDDVDQDTLIERP